MKNNQMIVRLRTLRQRREENARKIVAEHQVRVSEAQHAVERTSQMLAEHVQRTVDEQNAAVSSLADRIVKAAELHLAQSRYEASFARSGQIKAQGEAAVLVQKQREDQLTTAQQQHLQSRKALTKLEKLADRLERRATIRGTAVAELIDDERRPHTSHKQ